MHILVNVGTSIGFGLMKITIKNLEKIRHFYKRYMLKESKPERINEGPCEKSINMEDYELKQQQQENINFIQIKKSNIHNNKKIMKSTKTDAMKFHLKMVVNLRQKKTSLLFHWASTFHHSYFHHDFKRVFLRKLKNMKQLDKSRSRRNLFLLQQQDSSSTSDLCNPVYWLTASKV